MLRDVELKQIETVVGVGPKTFMKAGSAGWKNSTHDQPDYCLLTSVWQFLEFPWSLSFESVSYTRCIIVIPDAIIL